MHKHCLFNALLLLSVQLFAQSHVSAQSKPPRNATTRINILLNGRDPDTTDLDVSDFIRLAAHETFEDLDKNHNGTLTYDEFTDLDYRGVDADFTIIVGGGTTAMTAKQFDDGVRNLNTRLSSKMRQAGRKMWDDLIGGDKQSAHIVEAKLIALDKAKVVATGPGLIPGGGGYVLSGKRTVKKNKTILDKKQRAVLLRIIQDYTQIDTKATAATLGWSKSKDGGSTAVINGALRLDFFEPNSKWTPAIGIQENRSGTGSKRKDTQKLFLVGEHSFFAGNGFFQGVLVDVGPVYELDQIKHFNKITGMIQFEPVLNVGRYPTGVWVPFSGISARDGEWESFFAPRLAFELSHITRKPPPDADPTKNPETKDLFRYGFIAGLRAHKQLTLKYTLSKRNLLRNFNSRYLYQEATIEFAFDPLGAYTLNGTYQRGEDSPDFKTVENYNLGFGIKF